MTDLDCRAEIVLTIDNENRKNSQDFSPPNRLLFNIHETDKTNEHFHLTD